MKYYSTRDRSLRYDSAEAIKMGLSRDGGLLTPTEIPQIDRAFLESLVPMRYQERTAKVMSLYLTAHGWEDEPVRFDVAEVWQDGDGGIRLEYLPAAFE